MILLQKNKITSAILITAFFAWSIGSYIGYKKFQYMSLINAARANKIDKAKNLIDSGVHLYHSKSTDWESIMYFQAPLNIAINEENFEIARLLIENGVPAHQIGDRGGPIFSAASTPNVEFAKYLIEKGAKVSTQNKMNLYSPIMAAVKSNQPEMLKFLIKNGANVNVKDVSGDYPLKIAVKNRNPKIVKILLDNGAFPQDNKQGEGKSDLLTTATKILNDAAEVNQILKRKVASKPN